MAGKPDAGGRRERSLAARLFWFFALWLAGVATLAAVAFAIRQLL